MNSNDTQVANPQRYGLLTNPIKDRPNPSRVDLEVEWVMVGTGRCYRWRISIRCKENVSTSIAGAE